MIELLVWSLRGAREQTLRLAAGIPADRTCEQAIPGEHHPTWLVGHLLLGDSYLLYLLGAAPLPDDFATLLARHGPSGHPSPAQADYDPLERLVERLRDTGDRRDRAVTALSVDRLAAPTPDPTLARAQPTIGHHLQTLVCHEGYHAGELAAWRKRHGIAATRWAFAPGGSDRQGK